MLIDNNSIKIIGKRLKFHRYLYKLSIDKKISIIYNNCDPQWG